MKPRVTRLNQFLNWCESRGLYDIRRLTLLDVDEFFMNFSSNHKASSTNASRRVVKVYLKWLADYKEIQIRVRPDAIRHSREPKPLPKAVSDEVIQYVIDHVENEQDRLMIIAIREGGMRIDEVINIRVRDILYDQIFISTGKGDEERNVMISRSLSIRLGEFARDEGRIGDDWLFQNVYKGYNEKMTTGTARLRIQRCFWRIAGVHMTPHQLRHSMSIGLLREGCDLVTIQHQLGHKDLSTTQVYLRVDDNFRRTAYKQAMMNNPLTY